MTTEQLKAQVINTLNALDVCHDRLPSPSDISLVESLCREMLAKGLEMAAVQAMGWREEDPPEDVSIDVWKYFGSQRELLAAKYREQANTLKETPCS